MLDSLTIDHGRKDRTRVGRCTDCRAEGVATPTTNLWAGRYLCEMHAQDREVIFWDCQVCYAECYGGAIPRSPRLCGMHNDIRKETL